MSRRYKCLKCGEICFTSTQICWRCPTIDLDSIPDNIKHQSVGLFLGEGNVSLRINNVTHYTNIIVQMALRADDADVLRTLQAYFTGTIWIAKTASTFTKSPMVQWGITRTANSYLFLVMVKNLAVIPAKKLRDVDIGIEWCEWRLSQPRFDHDPTIGYQLHKSLKATKAFDPDRCSIF